MHTIWQAIYLSKKTFCDRKEPISRSAIKTRVGFIIPKSSVYLALDNCRLCTNCDVCAHVFISMGSMYGNTFL